MKKFLPKKKCFFSILLFPVFLFAQNQTGNVQPNTSSSANLSAVCVSPPVLTLAAASGTACAGTPFTLNGNTFGGSATNVTLSDNGNGVLTSGTIATSPFGFSYIPAASDSGNIVTITLTTNNPAGPTCVPATATFQLTVSPNPVLIITNPPAACTPGTVNLTAPSVTAGSGPGVLSYWTNAAATTALANPAAVASSGTYYIKLTNAAGCSVVQPVTVTISIQPTEALTLFCDTANSTPNIAAFDFNNVGQTSFSYTYSIDGGPPISGTLFSPSHYNVIGLTPGQQVTFTLTWVGICGPNNVLTTTCNSTCTTTSTPNFTAIPAFCEGSPAPVLGAVSPNGISGTWAPAVVSNTVSGSYVFTPSTACANPQTLNVTVNPKVTPTFNPIAPVCRNSTPPVLPLNSTNSPAISGTWSPAVSTATAGTTVYTFTPNPGQCVSSTLTTLSLTVLQNVTPNFAAIPPVCSGTAAPVLAGTSPNGITGTWSPSTISNTTSGAYTFTPSPGQCSSNQVLNVAITPLVVPNFTSSMTYCSGAVVPALANTSPNGITGTWSPATISNTVSGTYTFTPNAGQCAATKTLTVTITPNSPIGLPSTLMLCAGNTPPPLPSTSPTGVTGTWAPAVISTALPGIYTYTFTANAGQCVQTATQDFTVTVLPVTNPDFAPIPAFCAGTVAPTLANTSPNGVTGSWSPAVINNTVSGSYTFTPSSAQCATPQILNVTVIPRPVPTFDAVTPFCEGSVAPTLPLISNNGFTGTWSPAVIDNMASGTYLFTPDPGLCAATALLNVVVLQPIDPNFPDIAICSGTTAPILGSISPNGIQGTWVPATIDNTLSGPYVFTPDVGECANQQTINVLINEATLSIVTTAVSNAFSENQVITVIAMGPGNYLYQLDYGLFQESNIFQNVGVGLHSVTVVDANRCAPSITIDNILVIGYPPYFTPNGDNYHDFWNITTLNEPSRIFIFDRYGKLIKQISPEGLGWDGTYNGEPLPSSDYWFLVKYNELGAEKEFRSHFSLKR